MGFNEIIGYLADSCAITTGLMMKFSNNTEKFGSFKKYWLFLIIGGILLFSFDLYKYLR